MEFFKIFTNVTHCDYVLAHVPVPHGVGTYAADLYILAARRPEITFDDCRSLYTGIKKTADHF